MNKWKFGITPSCLILLTSMSFAQDAPSEEAPRFEQRGPSGFGGPGFGGPGGPGFGGPGGPGFGQRGGFGGRGGLLGELRNDASRTELNITEDQQQQLTDLEESSRRGGADFADIGARMQSAQTEEERQAIRAEMQSRVQTMSREADEKVRSILTPEQATRLQEIRLQREGPGIFARDEQLAEQFSISPEQISSLQNLGRERFMARQELGQGTEEERKAFDEEWDAKFQEVLTTEQRTEWLNSLGNPAPPSTRPSFRPPQPSRPRTVIIETVPQGSVPEASFRTMSTSAADSQLTGTPSTDTAAKTSVSGTVGENPTTPEGAKPENLLSFNFRYAPWSDVLRMFAEESHLSLDLNAVPPGTFNYFDNKKYTPTEALDIINGYLLPKGFCLIRRDGFLVCINIDEPIPPSLIPIVSVEEIANRGKNELITVIFPLAGVNVEQIASEVNEIRGPQGKVVGLKSTNSVMVTDIGSNLRRIRDLLNDVTERGGPEDITFKAYTLKNIPVSDAAATVRSLLGLSSGTTNVSSVSQQAVMAQMQQQQQRGGPGSQNQQPQPQQQRSDPNQPKVTVDLRTNQLLVNAKMSQHLMVEQALKTIDVEGDSSVFDPSRTAPYLKVYTVEKSDSREVTKTIDALIPGIVVNDDSRNRKIHIQATTDQHRQVEQLISQMEGQQNQKQVAVYPLSKLDPGAVASTLRSMFLRDSDQPIFESDTYGRQLIVRANVDQLEQIKTLLAQLGESGTGQRSTNDSRIRNIPLQGRDPSELIPLLERMWQTKSGTTIRVIDPSRSGESARNPQPVGPRHPLERGQTSGVNASESGNVPTESMPADGAGRSARTIPARSIAFQPEATNQSELELLGELNELLGPVDVPFPTERGARRSEPNNSAAPVSITIMGDELVISSSDAAQLDEFENLLQQTMQAVPPRITWTVFSLRSSDATETANMLRLLFPGASVSSSASSSTLMGSLSSGASSLGSNLLGAAGLSSSGGSTVLKIIPDVRLNALFITGPAAQVREVEQMLNILDSNGLIEDSMRDKIPRMIPVQHANAQEVHDIVKEVYKTYIDPPRTNDQNNPLAMLAAGRGGNANNLQVPPVKMALSLDASTSNLIVWSDEPLYREVEALVQSLDQASSDAGRSVQIVTLENSSPIIMQNTLNSLIPQVKISTTGSRSTGTTSTPTPSPSTPPFTPGGGFGRGGFGGGNFGGGGFGGGNFGRGGFGGGGNFGGRGR